jgi:hypothetical protein
VCGYAVDADDRSDHRLHIALKFQKTSMVQNRPSVEHGRRVTSCGYGNVRSKRSSADVVVGMFATSALTAAPLTREIRSCPAFLPVHKCETCVYIF